MKINLKRLFISAVITTTAISVMTAISLAATSDTDDPAELSGSQIKLAAPSDVVWGRYVEKNGNVTETNIPGFMSWKCEKPSQYEYNVKLYDADTDKEIWQHTGYPHETTSGYVSYYDVLKGDTWLNESEGVSSLDLKSGRYYFTVQSLDSDGRYGSSDIVKSDIWEYKKPGRTLQTPTDLYWDGNECHWKWSADASDRSSLYGYAADYYWLDESTGEYKKLDFDIYDDMLNEYDRSLEYGQNRMNNFSQYGNGKYFFTVRAVSMDPEKVCSSPWSELSPVREYPDGSSSLADIAQKYADTETLTDEQKAELKNSLAEKGTENLRSAILADSDYRGNKWENISKLKELEEKAGGPAAVDATNAPEWLDKNEISIIGANLNSENGNARLSIGQADDINVSADYYSKALKFSMALDGADDPSDLKIPVEIILPLPDDIDTDLLVMLHFHNDGTYEEIKDLRTFTENEKNYVSIVLTSFSDFAIAERSFGITSVNVGDKKVNVYTGGIEGKLTAAIYDKKGQMLESLSANAGSRSEVTLKSEKLASGCKVKLFLTDKNNRPLYEAKELTV